MNISNSMKRFILVLLLFVQGIVSAQVIPGAISATSKQIDVSRINLDLLPDYEEWRASTVSTANVPPAGSTRFWQNDNDLGFLSSQNWTGDAYTLTTIGGKTYYSFLVNPRVPTPPEGEFHHRAEITRRGNTNNTVLGTREILSFGYRVPSLGLFNRTHGIAIMQFHTGSAPGGPWPSNYPAFYLELAYAGQEDDYDDEADLNELVVINKVKEFELGASTHSGRKNTGIIFSPDQEYYFIIDMVSGIGENGYLKIMLKQGLAGSWATIYEENESTAWSADADGGSNSQVHGYWKLGVYAHGLKTEPEVEEDEDLNGGTYYVLLYMTPVIKNARLSAGEYYRGSSFIINAFDPTK
jgi:hypothetical protein